MSAPVRIQSPRYNVWFPALPERLSEAAAAYELTETDDWSPLDELSSRTRFEGLKVSGEFAMIDNGQYVAPGRVYVELVYDEGGEDETSFHDSFPTRVFFEIVQPDQTVTITRVEVDTSSFFEN